MSNLVNMTPDIVRVYIDLSQKNVMSSIYVCIDLSQKYVMSMFSVML